MAEPNPADCPAVEDEEYSAQLAAQRLADERWRMAKPFVIAATVIIAALTVGAVAYVARPATGASRSSRSSKS